MSLRVLIAVTHLLGAGHLTRSAAIARALAADGHHVVLATGGRPTRLIATEGMHLVQLPPVAGRVGDLRTLRDETGAPADAALLESRRAQLLALAASFRPEVLVTELYPFGRRSLAAEFDALLAAAAAARPRPLVAASIRDIVTAPGSPAKAARTLHRLASGYDLVLVHGDPALVPLEASWPAPLPPGLLAYTGYVDGGGHVPPAAARSDTVVVSGGSSAAGLPLYRAALAAARIEPGLPWLVLVGHGVPEEAVARLAEAAPPNARVERARPDFRALLARSALFVGQAGYNTVIDLVASGARAVLVPFEDGGETEQRLRAGQLAVRGRATVLPEAELSGPALARRVREALAAPLPAALAINLDGAARSARLLAERHAALRGRPSSTRIDGTPAPLRPVRAALDRAAAEGRTVPVWWRDDDAVEPTPALERLIAIAGRAGVPLAIAAIPAGAGRALADRLRAEEAVRVLVHGWRHANHAPPGAKPAEFGPHRDPDATGADLTAALAAQFRTFGAQALPVLVPPWNRLDPGLVPPLASRGFAGWSGFGTRPAVDEAGPRRIDTHLDPISWRGSRSLADEDGLADRLVAALEARADGRGDPVGLLTHHLVADEAVWRFTADLVGLLAGHPAVRWPPLDRLWTNGFGSNTVAGEAVSIGACP